MIHENKMRRYIILIVGLLISLTTSAQPLLQQPQIEGNVPEPQVFELALKRDLVAYFKSNGLATADRVEFRLLRDAPTQSGVAYPKYYAWINIYSGKTSLQRGAVRLAAIDKQRFEVTHFVSRKEIQDNVSVLDSIFPAALIPLIVQYASAP